jgi:hypothetical protein
MYKITTQTRAQYPYSTTVMATADEAKEMHKAFKEDTGFIEFRIERVGKEGMSALEILESAKN